MNRVNDLFGIKYPIIQGGMIWCSGWRLSSAVSNSGGLGLIGSGSMYPNVLREHIIKCKKATKKPFGVNLPLIYPNIKEHIEIIIEQGVKIVFTSAGNPNTFTSYLKNHDIKVAHVVSSKKFALKALDSGVDAIVAEGFEAGGHNGVNETTTLCLVPDLVKDIHLPIISAGGIADGISMSAAFALGAEGVQIGSRFAVSKESSAHLNFKNYVLNAIEGDTQLTLKELTAVRLLKNDFFNKIQNAYSNNATSEQLKSLLGRGRAKKGMFEGDIINGELEIGQVSSTINEIKSVNDIIIEIVDGFNNVQEKLSKIRF